MGGLKDEDDGVLVNEHAEFTLDELGLSELSANAQFHPITKLVARWFDVDSAFVSIVQDAAIKDLAENTQGADGWVNIRCAPNCQSFCEFVKSQDKPLVIKNSVTDAMVQARRIAGKDGVVAYLGVPIRLPDGTPIGALCAIDTKPREWTADDTRVMQDFAHCVDDEIRLRAAVLANERANREKLRQMRLRENLVRSFTTPGMKVEDRFQAVLKEACEVFGMAIGRIVKQEGGAVRPLFVHTEGDIVLEDACEQRLAALTQRVFAECDPLMVHDFSVAPHLTVSGRAEPGYGSYLGSPLVLDGTLYGALEFCSPITRDRPWTDTEGSYLSAASLVVTSNLGIFGQINMLRKSEAALLAHISQIGAR